MGIVSSPETVSYYLDTYNQATIRYGDMKKQLAGDMIAFTAPLRERILALDADDKYLQKVARMGAEKARESAQKTIREVREIIGFSAP